MKTGTKVFLGFLGGAAVGSVATFVGLKTYYKRVIEDEIIPDLKDDFNERYDELKKEMQEEFKKRVGEEVAEAYKAGRMYKSEVSDKDEVETEDEQKVKVETLKQTLNKKRVIKKPSTSKKDYTKYSKKNKVDKEPVMEAEDERNRVYSNTASCGRPYVIDIEKYGTECNNYRKETYSYWAIDKVFIDDGENPDLNVIMYIGSDIMDNYEDYWDGDTIFVRNDQEKVDYEIVIYEKSYAEYMSAELAADE